MLRIIHTADVHLGARHDDLGEQASAQRERQSAAFVATIDLAIAEKVDLVLIAGDLFDSNVQPRRSVERVAAQLKRLDFGVGQGDWKDTSQVGNEVKVNFVLLLKP